METPIIYAINKDLGLACTEEGQVNLHSVCMHNLQLLLFNHDCMHSQARPSML